MFDPQSCQEAICRSDRSEQAIRRAVVSSGGRCGIVEVTAGWNRWLCVHDAEDDGRIAVLDRVYLGQGENQ